MEAQKTDKRKKRRQGNPVVQCWASVQGSVELGKPYLSELNQLPETFRWAGKHSLEGLVKPIQAASCYPLVAVGSGGSFTTADFACFLHRELTGRMASALTPMEVVRTGIDLRSESVFLATAGGKN